MENPFDLRGPQFLLFYACLGVAITALAWWTRRARERADIPSRPLSDYLEIAFLRGGTTEAIRVAVITLLDRGVLAISGTNGVRVAQAGAAGRLTRRTERPSPPAPSSRRRRSSSWPTGTSPMRSPWIARRPSFSVACCRRRRSRRRGGGCSCRRAGCWRSWPA